jgi:hypothetical protein
MKNLLISLFIFSSIPVIAQTEKGDILIGGNLGFQTGTESNLFNISPNVGVFVANNFALGGGLSLMSSKQGDVRSRSFGIGPFARYYIGKAQTKPFIVTEFNFLSLRIKADNNVEIKNNGIGWLLGLGFASFINENVAVEGISGYNYAKFNDSEGGGGFALRLGFQVYLTRRSVSDLRTNVLGN